MTADQIKDNFDKIRLDIANAEKASGRKSGSVILCAVSKFHPAQSVLAAMDAGHFLFGENRVQEAFSKFTEINKMRPGKAQLHIIGSLQLNKVKKSVEIASCIQSVDREDLLKEIEKHASKLNKIMDVFLEIHTGEDSKSGYKDESELMSSLQNLSSGLYPHIRATGLMTMAPFCDDEKIVRKSFSSLRELREKVNKSFPNLPIKELSMGMSGDYKIAIEEGSTMVRIGTALFGEREYNKPNDGN